MSDTKHPRGSYLTVSQTRLLRDWGCSLRRMFRGEMPYLVGSALNRPDHRDVDVRIMLEPGRLEKLAEFVNLPDLRLAISLWGQQVTGLPIDFDLQDRDVANAIEPGGRHPIGLDLELTDETMAAAERKRAEKAHELMARDEA